MGWVKLKMIEESNFESRWVDLQWRPLLLMEALKSNKKVEISEIVNGYLRAGSQWNMTRVSEAERESGMLWTYGISDASFCGEVIMHNIAQTKTNWDQLSGDKISCCTYPQQVLCNCVQKRWGRVPLRCHERTNNIQYCELVWCFQIAFNWIHNVPKKLTADTHPLQY